MPDRTQSLSRAALWMSVAVVSFSVMAVTGREASRTLGTAELLVWRSVIGAIVLGAIVALSAKGFNQLRTSRLALHGTRNVLHFFGQYCWFVALTMIPLAQLFALEFTSPIWVTLFAPFLLGERFTPWKALAVALGFAGVLLVARPGSAAFGAGQVWALVAAFGFAGTIIATKRLSSSESALCIVFFMTTMQIPIGLLATGGLPTIPPDTYSAIAVLGLSIASLSAHFSIAQAFKCADATLVVPMDFFRLPLIAVVGVVLYAEPFDILILLGGALIFIGNFLNLRAGQRT